MLYPASLLDDPPWHKKTEPNEVRCINQAEIFSKNSRIRHNIWKMAAKPIRQ